MTDTISELSAICRAHRQSYAWQHPERPDVAVHTARSFGLFESTVTRIHASRPLPEMDEDAFEVAVGEFFRARRVPAGADAGEIEQVEREALETFLAVYTELTH